MHLAPVHVEAIVYDSLCNASGRATRQERAELAWKIARRQYGIEPAHFDKVESGPDSDTRPDLAIDTILAAGELAFAHGALRSIIDEAYAATAAGIAYGFAVAVGPALVQKG